MWIFRFEEENMRKSINNVLEKLNVCLGSYKVCEYKTETRGIWAHLDPFEKTNWTQPGLCLSWTWKAQTAEAAFPVLNVRDTGKRRMSLLGPQRGCAAQHGGEATGWWGEKKVLTRTLPPPLPHAWWGQAMVLRTLLWDTHSEVMSLWGDVAGTNS